MMMDKGLSINDTKNFIDMCGPHTDIIKLGLVHLQFHPILKQKLNYTKMWINGLLRGDFVRSIYH